MTGMPRNNIRPSAEGRPTPLNLANSNQPTGAAGLAFSPLEYMLQLLRDEGASKEDRKWAAYHAAPFCHSKLSSVEHGDDVTLRHEDALDLLE
jgi:hypothetical protein